MKNKVTISCDSLLEKMNATLKELGLNYSQNRNYVVEVLYSHDEHLSIEEITKIVNSTFSCKLSKTTIYSIVNLLVELKIINALSLPNDPSKKTFYELNAAYHHDHIICTNCHKIVEFYDSSLEGYQEDIASKKDFLLLSHSLLLFGLCEECS
ncbi:MAG: Fur family transcriptional regulator [Campylobacteraceae bacterium]